ncbi:MAG: hypothetical protein M3Y85_09540 [Bacteroidota bacterium]|nr:hypothetical protein [Bacteroidota bacterium]
MQLMMYLQNDLIEAVPLNRSQVPVPGYLGKIKRGLKEKHQLLLQQSAEDPEFLVIESADRTKK